MSEGKNKSKNYNAVGNAGNTFLQMILNQHREEWEGKKTNKELYQLILESGEAVDLGGVPFEFSEANVLGAIKTIRKTDRRGWKLSRKVIIVPKGEDPVLYRQLLGTWRAIKEMADEHKELHGVDLLTNARYKQIESYIEKDLTQSQSEVEESMEGVL